MSPSLPLDTLPTPSYGAVVPFYNEVENAAGFLAELDLALSQLCGPARVGVGASCEVILVDDGSNDGTGAVLDEACVGRCGWRVLHFTRNCGQAAALYAGLQAARAERLILLDGDGQNAPADIPALLRLLDDGADLAVGVRVSRQDTWGRRVASRVANAVRRRLLRDGAHDTGCGLKAMRREVVGALIPIRTLYSFMPALAVAAGFRVAEAAVTHRPRGGGKSKYSVRRFLGWPLLDLLGLWWFVSRRAPVPGVLRRAATGEVSASVRGNGASGAAAPDLYSPAQPTSSLG